MKFGLPSRVWSGLAAVVLALLSIFQSARGATIIIVNLDGPGEGLNDPTPVAPIGGNPGVTIGQQRLNVFNRAAEFWGARLVSAVPIRVAARFDSLSCTANSGILGSAGPIQVFRDFAGAPVANTYYASALANSLAGLDLDATEDDIDATFNSDVGKSGCLTAFSWYYGFDHAAPGNGIDFLNTVSHELAHGLGFLSTVNLSTGTKFNGFDDTFMLHLEDHRTGELFPTMTDAERASANTATGNLHWVGTNVLASIGILSSGASGGHVRMYAPNPTQPGSSVSHWDTVLTPDELMEPFDTATVDFRLTVQLMKDIGWKLAPPKPLIVTNSATLLAENCGFGNSAIDPGETVTVSFSLRNAGTDNSSNVVATLLTGSGVGTASTPQNYGALLANGAAVTRSFSLSATGSCATTIAPTLHLQDGTNDLGSVSFPFKLGSTIAFTNNAITSIPSSGSGSPYPSTLVISNQTDNLHGLVVRLIGLSHANPDDLDVLLVGPAGQKVMLMSDAGGSADINNVTLTFDDDASATLPDSSQIISGTFKPTDFQTGDTFTAPAPAGPYGTSLSVFDGTNPNGTWQLYIRDDASPRSGSLAGWSLSFPACCNGEFSPLLTLSTGTVTYVENALPVTVDASATVLNAAPDFNNGSLTVQVVTNATADDELFIRNDGSSAGQIGLSDNSVTFGNVPFGTFTINPGPALIVSFNPNNVTTPAVQALVRAVTFRVNSDNPSTALRTLKFSLGNGRASALSVAFRTVGVTAVNDAPTLLPISDQTVDAGQPFTVSASASDVDTSQNQLRFSLGAGAPGGAAINSTSGLFSWTPSNAQAASTNSIILIVSDQGAPSLTATQMFKIIVRALNHAPILATIPNRAIHLGGVIIFTNQATDPDGNLLTFSLTNAPTGVLFDGLTGVFAWTPSAAQAPSTNVIGIAVTDNGVPPLTDSQSFSIVVQLPPRIESISLSGTNVALSWTAIAGSNYHVQYKTNLDDPTWLDLLGTTTATTSIATRLDPVQPGLQRFYRIVIPQ